MRGGGIRMCNFFFSSWFQRPRPPWVQLGSCLCCCVPSPASVNSGVVLKQLEAQQMQMHVLGVEGEERSRRETAGDTFTAVLKVNTCCPDPDPDPGAGGTGGQSVKEFIILMFDRSV